MNSNVKSDLDRPNISAEIINKVRKNFWKIH